MKILLDNGHGEDTKGKRSPDGRLLEWSWTREITKLIEKALLNEGIDVERVVPEDKDISLTQRVKRVNSVCAKLGAKNVLFISVHINAAGCGKWMNASGWTGWIAKNASANSKLFAQLLYAEAEKLGLKGNRSVPKEKYWQADFAVIAKTNCPAVLTENMFQDNKEDVEYLLSTKGKQDIVKLHVEAIKNYIKQRS